MAEYMKIANPGSAIGEAISAFMEKALAEKLTEIADLYGYHYITSGVRNTKGGIKPKKILMSDNYGNQYHIDGVLANQNMQPLILFESKYIRYKKHNKEGWICHAHSAVRKRYHSIRSSIAILAGNWSGSSQAMMTSNDINLFLIPFDLICELLLEVGIDFSWGEKEKEKAQAAWYKYNALADDIKLSIGRKMLGGIEANLMSLITSILDDSSEREIKKVIIEIVSSLGEVKIFDFDSVENALDFLKKEDLQSLFLTTDSFSLFDPPPTFDD